MWHSLLALPPPSSSIKYSLLALEQLSLHLLGIRYSVPFALVSPSFSRSFTQFFLWLAMLNSWPSTFTWLVFRHFAQTHHDATPLSTGGLHPCIPAAWFGVGEVWWVIWPLVCGTAHRFHFESPTSGPPRFCVTAAAHARPSAVAPPSRNFELYLLQFPATLCFPCVTPATSHFPRVFSCHITLPSRNSCHITLPPCVFLPHYASLA